MADDVAAVVSSADIAVTNSASPNPVTAGSNITYTQVVTNNGPSAADNAQLVSAVPANTTFVSMTPPAGWTCQIPGVGKAPEPWFARTPICRGERPAASPWS